eukprot:6643794-Pyramimonas_sp.AAC.1
MAERRNLGGNPPGRCQCLSNLQRRDEVAGGQVAGHALRLDKVAHPLDTHLTEVTPQPNNGSSSLARGNSLLGDHEQFCHAFYHVTETAEAPDIVPVCLREDLQGGKCFGNKGVVLVARLVVASCRPAVTCDNTTNEHASSSVEVDHYVARYTNCPNNEHAETFLMRDKELVRALVRTPVVSRNLSSSTTIINYLPYHHVIMDT